MTGKMCVSEWRVGVKNRRGQKKKKLNDGNFLGEESVTLSNSLGTVSTQGGKDSRTGRELGEKMRQSRHEGEEGRILIS